MNNIYMVGIKGVGMTALAVYLKERGKNVWGSDVDETFPTDSVLREHDIDVSLGFDTAHIDDSIDLVITTGAHGGLTNIEVTQAERKKIPVYTQAYELGQIMESYQHKIAVCGAHGKTTTSAMAAFVLNELGYKSSHVIGASRFSGLYGGHYGGDDYLVVEADEYATSPGVDNTARFLSLNPTIIICTNIDFDHPDIYASIEEVKAAYLKFFQKLNPQTGTLIYNGHNEHLKELVGKLSIKNLIPYYETDTEITLSIPGRHNKLNAQGILKLAGVLGIDTQRCLGALRAFRGVNRRFEKIVDSLYDDYAHHPAELLTTVESARQLLKQQKGGKVILVFQPHTFSRTSALLTEFAQALSEADTAFVLDVFASAREGTSELGTSQQVVEEANRLGHSNVAYSTRADLIENLKKIYQKGDIIVTAGAGSIYEAHSDIIRGLLSS